MIESISRRTVLHGACASFALMVLPKSPRAEETAPRTFTPGSGTWRNFEVITTVHLRDASGQATVWVPVPTINTHWQRSLSTDVATSAQANIENDEGSGARFVVARIESGAAPEIRIINRVQTRDRSIDWKEPKGGSETAAALRHWTKPSILVPTDGIVRKTARQIVGSAHTDVERVRRIYDWVVVSTYRDPKVAGCGVGDIKAMLESGNLSGKCADINGLFVGLCRAAGIPARDVYGLRLAPSAFGYNQLGANSAKLQGAQHCRSEVYLADYGWVAMDPADVDKVMRQETSEWIRDAGHPLVTPVRKALFGNWEGNWMAYNTAADVTLPGAGREPLPFLMYPHARSDVRYYDPYDPDNFKYTIVAHEISVGA